MAKALPVGTVTVNAAAAAKATAADRTTFFVLDITISPCFGCGTGSSIRTTGGGVDVVLR
ncbi:hypothetical protein GCM10010513_04830 [Streptomyces glebosus]|nr:hypothetical protein GCM10010513_04830 [Streptomyces glebosus]